MASFGEELAFLKTQALALQHIPLTFANDYQPPLSEIPKKVLPFQITILPPPTKSQPTNPLASDPSSSTGASSSSDSITLIIKSTKPSITFKLTAHPTDTIAHIKAQLASENPRAPASEDQRFLLKGKVLADNKLLKEYPISEPTNITLMSKQGSNWTGEERTVSASPIPSPTTTAEPETIAKPAPKNLSRPVASHSRSLSGAADEMPVPSLTISPTPDGSPKGKPHPTMSLDMDLTMMSDPPRAMTPTVEGFYHVISDPEFWQNLLIFLNKEFKTPDDAQKAWEDFFLTSKTHLTAHEIAKIRDVTGIVAMAGN